MPRRHAMLFAVALVVPCTVLVVLGLWMIREGGEVARVRQMAERQTVAGRAARELTSRLERIALDEAAALAARSEPAAALSAPLHNDIALLAWVRDGRLDLPWDVDPAAARFRDALAGLDVARRLDKGLREEARGQLTEAQMTVSRLRTTASDPAVRDWATLVEARILVKCNCPNEARTLLLGLFDSPHVDDLGVPLAVWAASQLQALRADGDSARILTWLAGALAARPAWSPAAWYQARALVDAMSAGADPTATAELEDVRARITAGIEHVERALELARAWPAMSGALGSGDDVWLPFAGGRWLVGTTPSLAGRPPLAVAVDAEAAEAGMRTSDPAFAGLTFTIDPGVGQRLGSSLPGLGVVVPDDDALLRAWALQRTYYIVALFAILGVALAGALLFWRDVRRELRVAELRSQFVASVSHELRTPLTAIRMFAETLAMDRPLDTGARAEYLDTIVTESERLTRLVNNVLDFSKIERGEKVYRLEPASLSAIARSAARAMHYPLTRQGFDLRLAITDGLPPVHVDQDAVEQAVLNLLSNAVKYSGRERAIDLSVDRRNGHAVIAVTDRGLGVRPEDRARIFDRFYRASGPDVDRIPGAGLGLAIVDHIVRAHGGHVEVTSAEGVGSTFAIHLPIAAALSQPVEATL